SASTTMYRSAKFDQPSGFRECSVLRSFNLSHVDGNLRNLMPFLTLYSGGFNVANQFTNMGGPNGRKPPMQQPFTDGPAPPTKSKLCNRINTPEGCMFNDKCRFAHSEAEIGGRPSFPSYENPRGPMNFSGYQGRFEPSPAAANFGQSATAKISIESSLAGPVIDHETDPNQKNIELEGSFDQIKEASAMVQEIIMNLGGANGGRKVGGFQQQQPGGKNNMKTKMCDNFLNGQCTLVIGVISLMVKTSFGMDN
ncbi:zinc finger CCCH domain-containing protein 14-like protein, partial [Tanacetum coccineum]